MGEASEAELALDRCLYGITNPQCNICLENITEDIAIKVILGDEFTDDGQIRIFIHSQKKPTIKRNFSIYGGYGRVKTVCTGRYP